MDDIDYSRYGSSKSIRETTYSVLRDAIISGALPPGERIVESMYAKKLNVSRTPIREALRMLENDGLVEYSPHKGVVVTSLSEADIDEIYAIRIALEMLVIERAVKFVKDEDVDELNSLCDGIDEHIAEGDYESAGRCGRAIHAKMSEISGMKKVAAISESLEAYMDRFSVIMMEDAERNHAVSQEHKALVEALRDRDLLRLKEVGVAHLNSARAACFAAYEQMRNKNLYL